MSSPATANGSEEVSLARRPGKKPKRPMVRMWSSASMLTDNPFALYYIHLGRPYRLYFCGPLAQLNLFIRYLSHACLWSLPICFYHRVPTIFFTATNVNVFSPSRRSSSWSRKNARMEAMAESERGLKWRTRLQQSLRMPRHRLAHLAVCPPTATREQKKRRLNGNVKASPTSNLSSPK